MFGKDVDLAPADVMATLVPLVELRQLHVPSRGVVLNAAPGFQLLMTKRTSTSGTGSNRKAFDVRKATAVAALDHPGEAELRTLVAALYPQCQDAAEKLVVCYQVGWSGHQTKSVPSYHVPTLGTNGS